MPFEFAFLDWLYQFRNPVMNTISIFFDYAGAHGEIWTKQGVNKAKFR